MVLALDAPVAAISSGSSHWHGACARRGADTGPCEAGTCRQTHCRAVKLTPKWQGEREG